MVAMPGTLIPFVVRENLRGHSYNFTLSKRSERSDIHRNKTFVPLAEDDCFKKACKQISI